MKSTNLTFTQEQFDNALKEADLTLEEVEGGKIEPIENPDFSVTRDIDVMFSLPDNEEDY